MTGDVVDDRAAVPPDDLDVNADVLVEVLMTG